jgi:hypothetical protein
MSSVSDIERAIRELPPAELAKLRDWFAEFDAARWDEQLANDVAAGKLDALSAEALADLQNGRCTKL